MLPLAPHWYNNKRLGRVSAGMTQKLVVQPLDNEDDDLACATLDSERPGGVSTSAAW